MKQHINDVHKDYKCKSCDKTFSQEDDLNSHFHTIHEVHEDYKCDSIDESESEVKDLKIHVQTVHEGRKDYNRHWKCEETK